MPVADLLHWLTWCACLLLLIESNIWILQAATEDKTIKKFGGKSTCLSDLAEFVSFINPHRLLGRLCLNMVQVALE